ncbi:uncharacterized protein KGF55_004526 [Candida pseudojiufengensis]|uniref:uncharacterized protein n=1 Tax=Candida pseudojiufengensis TaxID=497109 RepID=UPI002225651D|nr:uncharacterized protein KGF55_004526 [Candida pseudojiufengensis]KAI5960633.1 hypothetical protein KGF55_004526 [Candida pseudojiufengensis]
MPKFLKIFNKIKSKFQKSHNLPHNSEIMKPKMSNLPHNSEIIKPKMSNLTYNEVVYQCKSCFKDEFEISKALKHLKKVHGIDYYSLPITNPITSGVTCGFCLKNLLNFKEYYFHHCHIHNIEKILNLNFNIIDANNWFKCFKSDDCWFKFRTEAELENHYETSHH